jgi:hypothetical protein
MAFVIAEPCIGTRDTACVDACRYSKEFSNPIRTLCVIFKIGTIRYPGYSHENEMSEKGSWICR